MEPNRSATEPSVQSIERAVRILQCFLRCRELTLTEICNELGLHKSTGYGIIATLKNNGLLAKDEGTGKYRLGTELYRLAAHTDQDIRACSAPHVLEICKETGETVELVIPDGTHITYIEVQESDQWLRIGSAVGKRLPMYNNAAGKAILAAMTLEDCSSILDQSQLVPSTNKTLVSKDLLLSEFVEVRRLGYSVNRQELDYGLIAMAAVIRNRRGQPIGAISCSVPSQRCNEERINQIGYLLKQHCDEISMCMIQ